MNLTKEAERTRERGERINGDELHNFRNWTLAKC